MSSQDSAIGYNSALDDRISQIIANAGLCRSDNRFFQNARSVVQVAPLAALRIGLQWQSMTRAFMFTTVASLGVLAGQFSTGAEPGREVLGAFQTAYRVIGDDVANFAPEFCAVSPNGANGVHYVWWADSIVAPLLHSIDPIVAVDADKPEEGVAALIANMERLAGARLGAAVQLRVVEAIALDIAVAFRRIFAKVDVAGGTLYHGAGALDWIDSHIKAETSHARSVSDDETGMTAMAATPAEQDEFLRLAVEYTANWARALDDFGTALSASDLPAGSAN